MADLNPYHPPDTVSLSTEGSRDRVIYVWSWRDMRCVFVALLSAFLGTIAWQMQAILSGTPLVYQPEIGLCLWLLFAGFMTACMDPRCPVINWLMLYFGAYILNLPFYPPDPLIILGVIAGLGITLVSIVGALVPIVVATNLNLPSPAFKHWAGWKEVVLSEPPALN